MQDTDLGELDTDEPFHFDPSERKLVTQPLDLSIATLVEQWSEKQIVLPKIQRDYLWDDAKASRLIESLLLNIPIPVIYFYETNEANYEIIDGHQRVKSIARFLNNEFALGSLNVLGEHTGHRFFELSSREQRFLRMRTLRTIIISAESHPSMKYEIFERLNSGSILLNPQELRNSLYRGPFNDMLNQIVEDKVFRSLIGTKFPRKRMVDQEMLLRFFSLSCKLDVYKTPLKRFLNNFMREKRDEDEININRFAQNFFKALRNVNLCLNASAFRVTDSAGRPVDKAVNRALFEAQMLVFLWSDERVLAGRRQEVKIEIFKLFEDDKFMDAIQRATGDRSRTHRRIDQMANAVKRGGVAVEMPFELSRAN